jgi:hypothetical protein
MSTPITLASKDPNEAYSYTWTPQAGDTIASGLSIMPTVGTATLEATPSPINDNEAARFVLLGGADGEITRLTARATMASGDIVEQEIRIPIISSGRRCIDLAMAKQHLEYEDDDRDALIQQYIDAAQAWVEDFTGKLLFRRTIPQRFPSNSASLRFHVRAQRRGREPQISRQRLCRANHRPGRLPRGRRSALSRDDVPICPPRHRGRSDRRL